MDTTRTSAAIKDVTGKVEEGIGGAVGDMKSQIDGKVKQATATAQDLYGQARDAASDTAAAMRDTAFSAEDKVRHFIEEKPYTAMVAALALGWLLGRTRRPY
jgi:uncharacterized protein YjbJ (UPF0337 family)